MPLPILGVDVAKGGDTPEAFKAMNKTDGLTFAIEKLAAEVLQLKERVDKLEAARDLAGGVPKEKDKPAVSWKEAERDLGLI